MPSKKVTRRQFTRRASKSSRRVYARKSLREKRRRGGMTIDELRQAVRKIISIDDIEPGEDLKQIPVGIQKRYIMHCSNNDYTGWMSLTDSQEKFMNEFLNKYDNIEKHEIPALCRAINKKLGVTYKCCCPLNIELQNCGFLFFALMSGESYTQGHGPRIIVASLPYPTPNTVIANISDVR